MKWGNSKWVGKRIGIICIVSILLCNIPAVIIAIVPTGTLQQIDLSRLGVFLIVFVPNLLVIIIYY